jgi:tetratricopeptide (TPR) repeat protein
MRKPPGPKPAAPAALLTGFRHEYQEWNNCGPATLAMALSSLGRWETQFDLAPILKGNPDDKNVDLEDMATYARGLGLGAVTRVNGNLDRLKLLLSNGFPVVAETWFTPHPNDGMGHYRLVVGYDDAEGVVITYDSYNGPDVPVTYEDFDADWRVFNRAYLVIYPQAQGDLIAAIIGEDLDDQVMYARALARAEAEVADDPQDAFAWFNSGSALVGLRRFEEAAAAYDRARELGLPWRMLWYQFGPYEAYYATGRYEDLLALTEATLRTAENLEEAHYYRGLALRALGRPDEAHQAFATALKFNPHFEPAAEALSEG